MTIFTMSRVWRSDLLPKAVVPGERAPTHLLRGHFGAGQLIHRGGPTKAILHAFLPRETNPVSRRRAFVSAPLSDFRVVAPKIDYADLSALAISKSRSESDKDSATPHRLCKFDIYKL